jgi:PAS domain S-box-containing protein
VAGRTNVGCGCASAAPRVALRSRWRIAYSHRGRTDSSAAAGGRLPTDAVVLETVPAVVVVLDAEGRVVAFNCAAGELSGHGDEDVAGCDVWETGLIREEDQLGTRESFDHLRAGDFPNRSENRWITEGGQRRLLSWRNSAVLGDEARFST